MPEHDIFISYSHNDNISANEDDGWVDSFHKALYKYLTGKLGRKAKIWRDKTKMKAHYQLHPAVFDNLHESLIFVPILSPSFLTSEWCPKELEFFCDRNAVQGIETHIFPVVKTEIAKPPALLSGHFRKYGFYIKDAEDNIIEELDPSLGKISEDKFNQKINDLAREIAAFIVELDDEQPPAPPQNGPIIYLAEPSPDLFDKYLEIKRDLEDRKEQGELAFEFLPDKLPKDLLDTMGNKDEDANNYRDKVRDDIGRSRLSIHLIGEKHNYYPRDSEESYLQIETETAAKRDGEQCFNRLVWIPKDIYRDSPTNTSSHIKFIEKIRKNGADGDGFMQDSFEKFKDRIIEVIENKPKILPPPLPPGDPARVYVLYDKNDLETSLQLEEQLENNGFVIFPARDYLNDDPAEIDNTHNEYLSICDSVMIYWHKAKISWVRIKVSNLQRTKANRKQDFIANAVFCDGNLSEKAIFHASPPNNLYKVEGYEKLPEFLNILNLSP